MSIFERLRPRRVLLTEHDGAPRGGPGRQKNGQRQSGQHLSADTADRLATGDPDALLDQKPVSAQNFVVGQRAGYNQALMRRAECIALAHAAGWSKYRTPQRLGITRRAVDEALTRPIRTPAEFLAAEVQGNGGHENASDRRLKDLLGRPK